MNIVHVESFFHPDAGYQLDILAKYMAAKGHQVTVITGEIEKFPDYLTSFFGKDNIETRDSEYEKKYHVKIIRIPVLWYYSGRAFFKRTFFEAIDKLAPDVVFAHCHDDMVGIRTINYCLKKRIPVVGDTHMAEAASKNRLRNLFRFYYRNWEAKKIVRNGIPIIRTADIDYVNKIYGIPLPQCPIVSFGSDLMLFHPDEEIKRKMRSELSLETKDFVIIYAGKLDEYKGGLFLAESIKKKFDTNKNVVFIIIGNTVGEYGKKVKDILSKSENRVILFPTMKYEDLANYFMCADIAIIPKQSSLTFYDYQACGLPVIAEDSDVNRTRVSKSNGYLFESDSKEAFRNAIACAVNLQDNELHTLRENALRYIQSDYDYDNKCDEFLTIINNEIARCQAKKGK